MTKKFKLKTPDQKIIYGVWEGDSQKPLIIIIHGLGGQMDEDFYISAYAYFSKKGFSVSRFNLYSSEENARQMMDCSLATFSQDLDLVVAYFRRQGIKKIFLVGHSFGGLVIFQSKNQDFDGASLWDPSYKISFTKNDKNFPAGKYLKEIDAYLMKWGVNLVIGKKLADEMDALNWNLITQDFKIPFQIIIAGQGELKGAKNYLKNSRVKTNLTIIKEATHYFNDTEKTREQVFQASAGWFRKLINKKSQPN